MKKVIINLFVNGKSLQKVTVTCGITLILVFTGITLNTAKAQTYDPHDVEVINNLIKNNGLEEPLDNPEYWSNHPMPGPPSITIWTAEAPKKILELHIYGRNLKGAAVFEGLTALQRMSCSYNHLSKVDVTGCSQLQYLNCSDTRPLSELKATGCKQLQYLSVLSCGFTNIGLEDLDNLKLFDGGDQYVPLTLYKNETGEYIMNIYLNNPTFENNAMSYSGGILKCIDNTLEFGIFTTKTNKEGFLLKGAMHLTYSNVGINSLDGVQLKVYPNPSNDTLFIECEDFISITVKLYDLYGKEVLSQNVQGKAEIDISHLSNEVYIVNVISKGKIIENIKIVKQ